GPTSGGGPGGAGAAAPGAAADGRGGGPPGHQPGGGAGAGGAGAGPAARAVGRPVRGGRTMTDTGPTGNASQGVLPADSAADLGSLSDDRGGRLQAGGAIDLESVLRDHPSQAEALRQLLPALQLLGDVALSSPSLPPADAAADRNGPHRLGDFRLLR